MKRARLLNELVRGVQKRALLSIPSYASTQALSLTSKVFDSYTRRYTTAETSRRPSNSILSSRLNHPLSGRRSAPSLYASHDIGINGKLAFAMDSQQYWDGIYKTRAPQETSWYRPHLETSLEWIHEAVMRKSASIIDIGAGESTLIDDLLANGYHRPTVLDIAPAAITKLQMRLEQVAKDVHWLIGDVTTIMLPSDAYDVWHDRAVFHFLTERDQRVAYVRQLVCSLKKGGSVILATFGPEGPRKCSGLQTMRYDAAALHAELGSRFLLKRSSIVEHQTPFGTMQQFLYSHFKLSSG